ncbi:peroxisomal N(1)-acetyl-spermine/spermidine oxidase-like [Anoplophora glabripennis]|uniref:peroxisomal N(1)-acetyl-spermine/spermidine oxidase-like n=1 Tax=Anoplophora glabripennis TaxID=217634 RepID=UPI000873BA2C|nr:peroxisomal N(1)-acetyl-spermine/spermidine oxidase-like [Anoplophora glabripennis]
MRAVLVLALGFHYTYLILALKNNSSSVIIVGAGPAGIAAATKLLSNGFHNILILEAEPRIGGRINSVKFFDAYVDLGARWCHGQVNNIVYDMVKDMNLLGRNEFSKKLYHSSRKFVDQKFVDDFFKIVEDIYEGHDDKKINYTNLGEYCEEEYIKIVNEKFGNDPTKHELALSMVHFFEFYVLGGEGSFSWHDIAAVADYQECEGEKLQNWYGKGYKTFLDVLMKKYPNPKKQLPVDDKILLNKDVSKIQWNQSAMNKSVKLWCSDGSTYEADSVIFTPSVGVLKERAEEIFTPRLPQIKLDAIRNIGFGAVMKVYMHFPHIWWGNLTGFNLLWSEEDSKAAVQEFLEGPNWKGRSWISYMSHVLEADQNPHVLVAWFTGPLIPAIEILPNEVLINGIYFSLEKFLGHIYRVTKPDSIIPSKWYTNPHFRGTYSFQTPEAHRTSAESILAQPLNNYDNSPILMFAGEATNPTHYGTVQGAVETGYREANRILKIPFCYPIPIK